MKNSPQDFCVKSATNAPVRRAAAVVACLLVQLCIGILYLWSVFKNAVWQHYNWSEGAAKLVASFMIFGFVLGNLIGGFLQDKTNPRLVATIGCAMFCGGILLTSLLTAQTIALIYLTYSGLAGLGCGFAYASVLSCLQKWFPNKRGFASGLAVAAFGLSTVIFTPLSQLLLKILPSPSSVFAVLGLSFLILSMLACFFISTPSAATSLASNSLSLTPKQAIKKPAFWCIFFSSFFINATWNVLNPMIISLGSERSLGATAAGVALMITGITNALGRFSMASASDKFRRNRIMIAMAILTLICSVLLTFAQNYFYLIVVVLTAFTYGGPSAIMPAMTVDLAGSKYGGTNYGIILLSLGFSSVIFTSVSNILHKATGDYTASFIMTAIAAFVPVVLMIAYEAATKKSIKIKAKNKEQNETQI